MWILAIGGLLAILEWAAVARHNYKLEYFAKPATLLALILWFAMQTQGIDTPLRWLFLLGLALSLLGDTLLMFPAKRLREGVIAFLLAHVAYVFAFNSMGLIFNAASIALAIALLIIVVVLLRIILAGIQKSGKDSMRIPITIYAVVLGGTTWSAVTTFLRTDWLLVDAFFLASGSLLFMGSDILWAFDHFVREQPSGRVVQLAAYHIGQYMMAIGVWHHLISI